MSLWSSARATFVGVVSVVTEAVTSAYQAVKSFAKAAYEAVKSFATATVEAVKSAASTVASWISPTVAKSGTAKTPPPSAPNLGGSASPKSAPKQAPSVVSAKPESVLVRPAFDHVVQEGESAESIAVVNGLPTEKVWNDPPNANLKSLRTTPHILMPGDIVHVPALIVQAQPKATQTEHPVVVSVPQSKVQVKFCVGAAGKNSSDTLIVPRAVQAVDYWCDSEQTPRRTWTSVGGVLELSVPATARTLKVRFVDETPPLTITLLLRCLHPIDTPTGVAIRFENLGYGVALKSDMTFNDLQPAIRRFQQEHQLTITGQPDAATKDRLKLVHGS